MTASEVSEVIRREIQQSQSQSQANNKDGYQVPK